MFQRRPHARRHRVPRRARASVLERVRCHLGNGRRLRQLGACRARRCGHGPRRLGAPLARQLQRHLFTQRDRTCSGSRCGIKQPFDGHRSHRGCVRVPTFRSRGQRRSAAAHRGVHLDGDHLRWHHHTGHAGQRHGARQPCADPSGRHHACFRVDGRNPKQFERAGSVCALRFLAGRSR